MSFLMSCDLLLMAPAISTTAARAAAASAAVMIIVSVVMPRSSRRSSCSRCHSIELIDVMTRNIVITPPLWGSEVVDDGIDGRIADEDQEPEEQQHDRERHLLGGRLRLGLGLSERVIA